MLRTREKGMVEALPKRRTKPPPSRQTKRFRSVTGPQAFCADGSCEELGWYRGQSLVPMGWGFFVYRSLHPMRIPARVDRFL